MIVCESNNYLQILWNAWLIDCEFSQLKECESSWVIDWELSQLKDFKSYWLIDCELSQRTVNPIDWQVAKPVNWLWILLVDYESSQLTD